VDVKNMKIDATNPCPRAGEVNIAMNPVLHPKISVEEAQWGSIEHLLDEADLWLSPVGATLKGLSGSRIDDEWRDICPSHGTPSAVREFLSRAGADAPFMNPNLEGSYRPESYKENRDSASLFLQAFSPDDASTVMHCLDKNGDLHAAIVVIACDVIGEDYYVVDATNDESTVFRLHAPHGDLKESAMTMLEFLRLQLINYWLKIVPRGG
jgi:hypothetical protein